MMQLGSNCRVFAALTATCLGFAVACGGASAAPPVGLPPPEYQEPRVEPWPPPSASSLPASLPPAEGVVNEAPGQAMPAAPEGSGGSGATLPPGIP
jgi:hypothetical protein